MLYQYSYKMRKKFSRNKHMVQFSCLWQMSSMRGCREERTVAGLWFWFRKLIHNHQFVHRISHKSFVHEVMLYTAFKWKKVHPFLIIHDFIRITLHLKNIDCKVDNTDHTLILFQDIEDLHIIITPPPNEKIVTSDRYPISRMPKPRLWTETSSNSSVT